MRTTVLVGLILLALAVVLPGRSAGAQEKATATAPAPAAASEGESVPLAVREAEAAAYAMLYARVAELQVTPDVRVADFLATGADARAFAWEAVCRLARCERPQVYSDGVTSVQVSVPLEQVIAQLKSVCAAHYRGEAFKPQDFDQVVLYTTRASLWGFGSSRGEPRLAIADPAPVGWYDVGVFGRLDVRRQATDNAYRQLLAKVRTLRLTASRRVSEYLDSDQRVADGLAAFVRSRAEIGALRYLPTRLSQVELTIKLSDLVTELKGLSNAYAEGAEFAVDQLDAMSTLNDEPVLRVTGVAVPVAAGAPAPPAEEVWPSTSEAEPPENVADPDQAQLLAQRAAVARCREELRRAMLDKPVPGLAEGTTLGAAMTGQEGFRQDVDALLTNLRVVQVKELKGGRVRVTVELPTTRFNELLAHYAKLKQPPAEPAKP